MVSCVAVREDVRSYSMGITEQRGNAVQRGCCMSNHDSVCNMSNHDSVSNGNNTAFVICCGGIALEQGQAFIYLGVRWSRGKRWSDCGSRCRVGGPKGRGEVRGGEWEWEWECRQGE